MRESILFCNQLNQTEFLRTLAKAGSDYHFLRVMKDKEIIDYILESKGVRVPGKCISEAEEAYIYFKLGIGKTFKDAKDIASSINHFRDSTLGDIKEELKNTLSDDFPLKKELLVHAYDSYISYKEENGLIDKYDLIKRIPKGKLDVDLYYFNEFPISLVMKNLLDNACNMISKSIFELLPSKSNIKMVRGCYGITNEIDYCLKEISENHIPLDDTQIVLIHSEDLIYVMDYINRYHINTTYRMGVPLLSTRPGALLKYLLDLEEGYFGVDSYRRLFLADSFEASKFKEFFTKDNIFKERDYKSFIQYAGWLRLDFKGTNIVYKDLYINKDTKENPIGEALVYLDKELRKGLYSFIEKFYKNTGDSLDFEALSLIKNTILEFDEYDISDKDRLDILSDLLKKNVGGKLFKEGALNITTLENSFGSIRNNTFIIGLDSNFPGNPKENYLIFDEEFESIDNNKTYTSVSIIKQKENMLKSLLKVGNNIYITYPTYTITDLKSQNPSSLITKEMLEFKDINKKPYGYLDSIFNGDRSMMECYMNNEALSIENENIDIKPYDINVLLNKEYSPSKIFEFLNDNPLKFILENFYRVYIDDSDDPFNVIPANTKGDIIHNLMEGFQKDKISKEEFMDRANIAWENFIKMRPPLVMALEPKAREDFLDGVEKSYIQDPGNTFDSAEVEYHHVFDNGIKVGGRYDRLEKDKNGKFILVDYKTGKTSHHINNDPKSCIQGLLYAEIIEEERGIQISRIEYRYPYVEVNYIDNTIENKAYLYQELDEFKNKILSLNLHCENKDYDYQDKYLKLISLLKAVKR